MRGQGDIQTRPTKGSRIAILALALAILGSALVAALAFAAGAPIVSATSVSHITETSATLEATVNPNEKEIKAYFFEYVDQAGFEAHGFTGAAKTPSGTLPLGKVGIKVKAPISGLTAGVTYHFRLFAQNSVGKTEGTAQTFTTYTPPQTFGPCPNDPFRSDAPSGRLPDCRAYEQASPIDKNGGDLTGDKTTAKASVNGDRISFDTYSPIPGSEGAQSSFLPYLASRGAGAWSYQGTAPPQASGDVSLLAGWTPDFSHFYNWTRKFDDPEDKWALYDRSAATGSITTIVPDTVGFAEAKIAGTSDDGSVVFFEFTGFPESLTPEAPAQKDNLYVWDRATGTYRLAGIFNDGKAPPAGSFAGPYNWFDSALFFGLGGIEANYYLRDQHAISTDGSRAYFSSGGNGQLYLRKNPAKPQSPLDGGGKCTDPSLACTVHVSTSHRGEAKGPDPAGPQPAAFMGATPDGSKAFFASPEMLTDDANTGPEQPPAQIGHANVGGEEAKEVKPDFLPAHAVGIATSPDGKYIYWGDPVGGTIGRQKLDPSGKPEGASEPAFITPGPVDFDVEFGFFGGGTETVTEHVSSPSFPRYVAVDSEYVYWTNDYADGQPHRGTIGRAKLSPSGDLEEVEPEFILNASNPQGIAVNSKYIYWANAGPYQYGLGAIGIGRAELDGENVEPEFAGPYTDPGAFNDRIPRGLALSPTHIYLTINNNPNRSGQLMSMPLEGGAADAFLSAGEFKNGLRGVAVSGSHVYWGAGNEGVIRRADLDLKESSLKEEFINSEGTLDGLAIDGEDLYWSSNGEGAVNPGKDLYRFDAATGSLTDLTSDSAGNGGEVVGFVGNSDDGSYVYFVANGALAEGASPGGCRQLASGEGSCNLYLSHEGQISFIARLADSEFQDWTPKTRQINIPMRPKVSRVSRDGRTLLFRSSEKLTSYENKGTPELYRYRDGPGSVVCVSCNPTGVPPSGMPTLESIAPAAIGGLAPAPVLSRNLSPDGNRVFFETPEALVTADTNGEEGCPTFGINGAFACQDVYEWEAKGTGSCDSEAQNGGCLYLLSGGKASEPSYLLDASASGDDVFLMTRDRLVEQDRDELTDVYDARVGGGLVSQNPPPPPVPCEGEACKGGATPPPSSSSAGSASFAGPSNPKARHKNKKAKKKKRHHKHKRHAKKHGRVHR